MLVISVTCGHIEREALPLQRTMSLRGGSTTQQRGSAAPLIPAHLQQQQQRQQQCSKRRRVEVRAAAQTPRSALEGSCHLAAVRARENAQPQPLLVDCDAEPLLAAAEVGTRGGGGRRAAGSGGRRRAFLSRTAKPRSL